MKYLIAVLMALASLSSFATTVGSGDPICAHWTGVGNTTDVNGDYSTAVVFDCDFSSCSAGNRTGVCTARSRQSDGGLWGGPYWDMYITKITTGSYCVHYDAPTPEDICGALTLDSSGKQFDLKGLYVSTFGPSDRFEDDRLYKVGPSYSWNAITSFLHVFE